MRIALVVVTTSLLLLVTSGRARAQSPSLSQARRALGTYDVDPSSVFATLRDLGPRASGSDATAREARYLRAMAAADLHVLALAVPDPELDQGVADALDTSVASLADVLRDELARARARGYRGAVDEELQVLEAVERYAHGEPPREHSEARRAALYVLGVARALDAGTLDSIVAGPDPAPPEGLDPAVLHAVAVLRDARASAERAARGAHLGDPLLVRLRPVLAEATARITSTAVRGEIALDSSLVEELARGSSAGGTLPDVLVVAAADHVELVCAARITVVSASAVDVVPMVVGCPAYGATERVELPAFTSSTPRPGDRLVEALRGLGAIDSTTLGIATLRHTPMMVVARVLRSLERAGLVPSTLVLGASDGALDASPLALAPPDAAPPIQVHVRLGGYCVTRARARDSAIPRVRGPEGLQFDRAALDAVAREASHAPITLDGMSTADAAEVLQALRRLTLDGAQVSLALR